jgi:hypothetical protein
VNPQIFVPAIGQFENIGDVYLRRPLLNWLREAGSLHVYVGRSGPDFETALGLQPRDRVYHSFAAWYRAGLRAALAGQAHYCFKPGEIQLTLTGMKEHLAMLPLAWLARARGGMVLRVGAGARNFSALPRLLMRPSVAVCHRVWWRDAETMAYLGAGQVMPDLAFDEGDAPDHMAPAHERDRLVVSMRGDREPVPAAWVEAVRAFARRQGLGITVVTQVLRDEALSVDLAHQLDAELLGWDGTDHAAQEARLRALYRHTRWAISDRLHVLIGAYTHGAAPLALLTEPSRKIDRHLDAAGLDACCIYLGSQDAQALAASLDAAALRAPELVRRLPAIRHRLQRVRDEVLSCLNNAPTALRPHWGAHGEP